MVAPELFQCLGGDRGGGLSSAIVGPIVGGVIALATAAGTTFGLEYYRRRTDRKRLAFAIGAEVLATLRMVVFRKYHDTLLKLAALAREGHPELVSFRVPDDYLTVSRAAADQLGTLLGKLPHQVAEILVLASAIKADTDVLEEYQASNREPDAAHLAELYDAMAIILARLTVVGSKLVHDIHDLYPSFDPKPWPEVETGKSGETAQIS